MLIYYFFFSVHPFIIKFDKLFCINAKKNLNMLLFLLLVFAVHVYTCICVLHIFLDWLDAEQALMINSSLLNSLHSVLMLNNLH